MPAVPHEQCRRGISCKYHIAALIVRLLQKTTCAYQCPRYVVKQKNSQQLLTVRGAHLPSLGRQLGE